jgi:transposase
VVARRRRRDKQGPRRNKVTVAMVRKIYELHTNLHLSFKKIGQLVYCSPATAYTALKRFDAGTGRLLDRRVYNGRNNRRLKITPKVQRHLLDPATLQRWGFMGLQQRCLQLERDLGVLIKPATLRDFYVKHNVRNRVVGFKYQQSQGRPKTPVLAFSLCLAKLVQQRKPLVYFDESSFHMWMRNARTWTTPDCAVKWQIPKIRGQGVTVFGAISTDLPQPVFMKAPTTSKEHVLKFLGLLRRQFRDPDQTVFVVLDNHPSHHTKDVTALAKNLNFELLFLPPYCPELNSIEALWGVLKRKVKRCLVENKLVTLTQRHFEQILDDCLDSIEPEAQQAAAQHNNRGFIFKCLQELLEPGWAGPASPASSVGEPSPESSFEAPAWDGGPFGHDDASHFHVNNPMFAHYNAMSPLQADQPRDGLPFAVPLLRVQPHFFPASDSQRSQAASPRSPDGGLLGGRLRVTSSFGLLTP